MFPDITFAELGWSNATLIAVCGLVVDFVVLAVLAFLIKIVSKVAKAVSGTKEEKPAVVAAPAAAPKQEEDDAELIAVITAAIAAELGTTPDTTRLTRIIRY